MALTLTREDHHLITFNLANACLVIDEADFYDEFTQANILILLEMLKYWNVPVLLMSASLPNSVVPLYQKIGYQTKEIVEDISDNGRIRFEIKRIVKYSDISEIEEFLKLCIEKETAIIYINTVDKAILFYDWFNSRLQAIGKKKDIPLFLYHSRFTEPDKKAKEKELISALGKDAHKNGKAKGIAILTQIGEMSVNISADIMISELCPIDRLSQRTGRMCRFDKEKCGELFVLIPFKNETVYPAPYGEFDTKEKKWIPCKAYEKTCEVIEETTPYTAARLVELINHVYVESINFSIKAESNSKKLKEYFTYNWLITSEQLSTENDSDTTFWKSRNIPLQDTVFVQKPKSEVFRSFLDYQSWKIQYSVEIPLYLLEKG
jgi:CRISPR-associated endonuclease/helicase Cas3